MREAECKVMLFDQSCIKHADSAKMAIESLPCPLFSCFLLRCSHQAINQHQDTAPSQNQDDVKAFEVVLKTCKAGTVVVVDLAKMNPANRAWCL